MTFLQIHALNQEIAQAPDMTLETRHNVTAKIKDGKLICDWVELPKHREEMRFRKPQIVAGLFLYRAMVKDMGLDQNALTSEIMEEIRWKKLTLTT